MADRSSSSDPSPAQNTGSAPPGLGEQFGRTRSAFFGLISAHLKLARAEFAEIADDIKRAAALGGIALLLLFLAGTLATIGTALFVGEVVFHSIGWGVLLGSELLIGMAVLLVLAIIDLGWGRAFAAFVVALAAGLAVTGVSLAAAHLGLRVAVALGVAALLLFWPICAAVLVFRHGFDFDKLKNRFMPDQTIAATKETIEWVREQMPRGRKS